MQKFMSLAQKIAWLIPSLAGMLTVMSLFSQYSYRIPWSELPIPLTIGFIAGQIFYWLLMIPKSIRPSAAIGATAITVICMLWMLFTSTVLAAGIILAVITIAVKSKPEQLKTANAFVSIVLIAALLSSTVWAVLNMNTVKDTVLADNETLKEKPDIYFIIPDRMPSHDALLESGYDNSAFLAELEARGYYVNPHAMSVDTIKPTDGAVDTSRTPRYVASVLNLGAIVTPTINYNTVSRMIKYHQVGKILQANGYIYHHIGTWWAETEVNEMADYNYVMANQSLMPTSEFGVAILDRSIFRYMTTYPFQFLRAWNTVDEMRREQHLFQAESFKEIAQTAGSPKFVFVHLILPHPPYVWTADGLPQEDTSLTDKEAYLEQIKFAEQFVLDMIDSVPDGIVIVQSDEGMGFVNKDTNKTLSNTQWNGVLTAWKIPGAPYSELDALNPTEILKYVIDSLR